MKKKKFIWDLKAEQEIWRAICAPNHWFTEDGGVGTHPKSLWWFVHLAWGAEFYFEKHPEQPRWLTKEIHGPFVDWLQKHILQWKADSLSGGTDRCYIASILPRGYGKTVISTKSATIWMQLDEPDMSTLVASSATALAADIYNAIRSVISGEDTDSWFTWLYGNWKTGAKIWNENFLHHGYRKSHNLSEPSLDVTAVGIGMTGYHHRVHNWDDPITINRLREGRVAYAKSVHNAVNASYNALQTNGLLLLTLTRYFDDDVAGRHLREEGVKTWTGMPCPNMMLFDKVPFGEGVWHVYFLQTEDELTGEPTHPLLWNRQKIAEAKRRDAEDFACQQQNNPGTGENAPLLESQLKDLFVDYKDFLYHTPVEYATVHIDTAFKKISTMRTGDDNAIVVWLHDARRNGIIYLDTDLMQASNEWREEKFNEELVRTCISLRRRMTYVKTLTDEVEPGGKMGAYKARLLTILQGAGLSISANQFKQLNRTVNKEVRIRTSLGYWVEGYVRILLHKDDSGHWIIPPIVRTFFNQILRMEAVSHNDLADAAADVFTPGIWVRPMVMGTPNDEGASPWQPQDEFFKSLSRPLTNVELYSLIDSNKEVQETMGPLHGWSNEDYDDEPRKPI